MSVRYKYSSKDIDVMLKLLGSNHLFRSIPHIKSKLRNYANRKITKDTLILYIQSKGAEQSRETISDIIDRAYQKYEGTLEMPPLEMTILNSGEAKFDVMSKEYALQDIAKDVQRKNGKNKVIIVDPILGMHSMVADIEKILASNVMQEADRQRYMALKMKLFTDILKFEGEIDPSEDIEKIQSKVDKISLFVYEVASRIDQIMKDTEIEASEVYGPDVVTPIMNDIRKKLDLKKVFIDFIDDLNM